MSESRLWNHIGRAQSLLSISKWSPLNGVLIGTTLGSFPTSKSKIYVLRAGVNFRESLLHRTNSVNKFGGRGTMIHHPGGQQGGEKGVWMEEGAALAVKGGKDAAIRCTTTWMLKEYMLTQRRNVSLTNVPQVPLRLHSYFPFSVELSVGFNQVQLEKPRESVSHSVTSDPLQLHGR